MAAADNSKKDGKPVTTAEAKVSQLQKVSFDKEKDKKDDPKTDLDTKTNLDSKKGTVDPRDVGQPTIHKENDGQPTIHKKPDESSVHSVKSFDEGKGSKDEKKSGGSGQK